LAILFTLTTVLSRQGRGGDEEKWFIVEKLCDVIMIYPVIYSTYGFQGFRPLNMV
jgi:hypothetical protein